MDITYKMTTMNTTTRLTLLCCVVAGIYTCFAYVCGAALPPWQYMFCAAVVSVQGILFYHSSSIIQWISRDDTRQDVLKMIAKVIFNLIICFGSSYGMLAKLGIQDGVQDDQSVEFLKFLVISVEASLAFFPTCSESGSETSSRRPELMAGRA